MIAGTAQGLPKEVKATGWKPGKKKGWKGLAKGQVVAYQPDSSRELSVAVVLYNDRNNQSVEAQSCRSIWTGTAVCHVREYRKSDAEGSEIVLEPTEEPVRCVIFYRALVKVIELYVDGRMMQGDASALSKGGWSFKLDEGERIRAIATATVLENQLLAAPELEEEGISGSGVVYRKSPEGSYSMYDERDRKDYRDYRLGLKPDDVRRRLLLDERSST